MCTCAVSMAKSKFEYVKNFEENDKSLPNTWIVVRLDGRAFHKFSDLHAFLKPNDDRALSLINRCAVATMNEFQDIVCSYGHSDEYSFILKKSTTLFSRRISKILTTVVSFFSSSYVFHWSEFFSAMPLKYPPTFDARIVLYPSERNLLDYLSWRQADCHINNLYNTCFWSFVHNGMSHQDAQKELSGTVSSEKNELLFSKFDVNYNSLPSIHRKGTFLIWESYEEKVLRKTDISFDKGSKATTNTPNLSECAESKIKDTVAYRQRKKVVTLHVDIIGEQFWTEHPEILAVA